MPTFSEYKQKIESKWYGSEGTAKAAVSRSDLKANEKKVLHELASQRYAPTYSGAVKNPEPVKLPLQVRVNHSLQETAKRYHLLMAGVCPTCGMKMSSVSIEQGGLRWVCIDGCNP